MEPNGRRFRVAGGMKMPLHYWIGGPRAKKGDYYWKVFRGTQRKYSLICPYACLLSKKMGVKIPRDTYVRANVAVSQKKDSSEVKNDTAILPLEE